MSCTPVHPCGAPTGGLGLVAPPPGLPVLRRRAGEFHAFTADVIARLERMDLQGDPLGSSWDVEGDRHGVLLAELWAYVAEGVAAYTELTAAEGYLGTAADWTDLRRLAALVGYRPRPGVAATGWVRAEVERGADPVVPAGTRVQAPGTPDRPAQTFEVAAEAQLRSEWEGLGATWVPAPAVPVGREVRFLGSPGFRAGDRVLFVLEATSEPAPPLIWFGWWLWLIDLMVGGSSATATPIAVASVVESTDELGTSIVRFDRDLDSVLDSVTAPYVAYRIVATAGAARRLEKVLRIPPEGTVVDTLTVSGTGAVDADLEGVVLDTALEDASAGQLAAIVDWAAAGPRCDVVRIGAHVPVNWEVAPGTTTRVSRLEFDAPVATLSGTGARTAYILDRRIVARHYTFPDDQPPGPPRLRLHPRPLTTPPRIAVGVTTADATTWEVVECVEASDQEEVDPGASSGLIVDLVGGAPTGLVRRGQASGNLLSVRHGTAAAATLGSGDAAQAGQRFTTPDAPVAYDLDAAGTPLSSLEVRVDGVAWAERPSLTVAELGEQAYSTRLAADGGVAVEFGDGERGARLPSGRGNVRATYRVGGGSVGEVPSGAIQTLLGSVRGVKKVLGAGPTTGGSNQDDETDLRRLAPTRARAFDRAVSAEDLVDLSLGYPGVSHAGAWQGQAPPGCACGGAGVLHLAFLRIGTGGVRPPLPAEVVQLSSFLDERRDVSVPLCVCAAAVTPVVVSAAIAVDPRHEPATVANAAATAVLDPDGPLAPPRRSMGQALDRSDVFSVLHAIAGVIGIADLVLPGAGALGRRGAARHELLVIDGQSSVTGAVA